MMKRYFSLLIASLIVSGSALAAGQVGIVDFRECLDQSHQGKKEQQKLEDLRIKMTASFSDKEKKLSDVYNKLNDPEYMDGLSPSAEKDLQDQFQKLSEEMNQLQYESSQLASQTQFKVLQTMDESVKSATKTIAERKDLELVVNKDTCFFYNTDLDITKDVIEEMNASFKDSASTMDEALEDSQEA